MFILPRFKNKSIRSERNIFSGNRGQSAFKLVHTSFINCLRERIGFSPMHMQQHRLWVTRF